MKKVYFNEETNKMKNLTQKQKRLYEECLIKQKKIIEKVVKEYPDIAFENFLGISWIILWFNSYFSSGYAITKTGLDALYKKGLLLKNTIPAGYSMYRFPNKIILQEKERMKNV